jgi:hypothetical protein
LNQNTKQKGVKMMELAGIKISVTKKVYATKTGIVIETEDKPIVLSWDIVDQIAEASEEHYQEQTLDVFKALISQKNVN